MKKIYLSPDSLILNLQVAKMISTSEGVSSSKGIGYGGVDNGGTMDPSVKVHNNVWDEEW